VWLPVRLGAANAEQGALLRLKPPLLAQLLGLIDDLIL
jgi:hypothetical protein